jgi:hypothetical protein
MKLAARLLMLGLFGVLGCGSAQKAAAKDPLTCERDPNCAKYRSSYIDCTRQCVDNPPCVELCRQVQVDPEVGH